MLSTAAQYLETNKDFMSSGAQREEMLEERKGNIILFQSVKPSEGN